MKIRIGFFAVCFVCCTLAAIMKFTSLTPFLSECHAASSQSSPLAMLNHRVTDAEYSKQLDKIITVSSEPENALHIVDPITGEDISVDLHAAPTSVAVGPDGLSAVVGHNGSLSYVDLNAHALMKTYPVSADVLDAILAGNGYAYVFSLSTPGAKINSLDLQTGEETQSVGYSIGAGTSAKLHSSGKAIYVADSGFTSSGMAKYDITKNTVAALYGSAYDTKYPTCGSLWISEDGLRIFTKCGNVFRSSENRGEDMLYGGTLGNIKHIAHLAHSSYGRQVVPFR